LTGLLVGLGLRSDAALQGVRGRIEGRSLIGQRLRRNHRSSGKSRTGRRLTRQPFRKEHSSS
jgi:hypothetical protein